MRYSTLVILFAVACGADPGEKTARSPTQDYEPPTATAASDGQVVGADNIRSADKLATSPRIGTGGLKPAARPPGVESEEEKRARERRKLCSGSEVAASDIQCQGLEPIP
jgi:hypothetical protein